MSNTARIAGKETTPKLPWIPIICGILGLFLLAPSSLFVKDEADVSKDTATEAFDTYEQLWRLHQIKTADKIASGELKTEQEVWDFQAKGQEPARKLAFEKLAKHEADYFSQKGSWSKEAHEKLLRSYAK